MQKIRIDLKPEKKSNAWMNVFLVFILLADAFLIIKIAANHFKAKELRENATTLSASENEEFEKSFDILNTNISKKGISWILFFDRIEQSLPGEVVITRLKTESAKGIVSIQGSSRTSEGVFKTLDELKKSHFRDVDLVGHSSAPKTNEFTFTLNAKYF